jgi:hypothetical protein
VPHKRLAAQAHSAGLAAVADSYTQLLQAVLAHRQEVEGGKRRHSAARSGRSQQAWQLGPATYELEGQQAARTFVICCLTPGHSRHGS